MLIIFFANKILELSKIRTLSKIVMNYYPNLQKSVLRKGPNLPKAPPRAIQNISVLQLTRKECIKA